MRKLFTAVVPFILAFVLLAVNADHKTCDDSGVHVKSFDLDGEITDLHFVCPDSRTILVLTNAKTLYRSSNDGESWHDQMDKLDQSTESQEVFGKGIAKIFPSAADKKLVFIQGVGTYHWITRDCGHSYELLDTKLPLVDPVLHASNPDIMMASAWTERCYGPGPKDGEKEIPCHRKLWLSKDGGKTWKPKVDYVQGYTFGKGDETIIYGAFKSAEGHQPVLSLRDSELDFTRNLFQTQHQALKHVVGFKVIGGVLYAATQDEDQSLQLFISRDDGVKMEKLEFPEQLAQQRYIIFDDGAKGIYVNVKHGDGWGNVYASDGETNKMVTVLRDNPMSASSHVEWVGAVGSVGDGAISIANVIEKGVGDEGSSNIRTVSTYDRGAHWRPIKPPHGKACDGCSLHLHTGHKEYVSHHKEIGDTAKFGPILSKPQAAGIVLATGNVGKALGNEPDEAKTYFSRDAGQSWKEVRPHSHVYEIGDHGGAIVMARNDKKTNEIQYSMNQFETYHHCSFHDQKFDVKDIVSEPNATSTNFFLHGIKEDGTGAIVSLAFKFKQDRSCEHEDRAGHDDSDFEYWSPSDGELLGCLEGKKTVYTRRKAGSECFLGSEYERKESKGKCQCTAEDYECNFCYERKQETTEMAQEGVSEEALDHKAGDIDCVWACAGPEPKPEARAPDDCQDTYKTTTAYRKVAGNECELGKQLDVQEVKCPSTEERDEARKSAEENGHADMGKPAEEGKDIPKAKVSLDEGEGKAPAMHVDDEDEQQQKKEEEEEEKEQVENEVRREEEEEEEEGGGYAKMLLFILIVVGLVGGGYVAYSNMSNGWQLNAFGRNQYAYAKLANQLGEDDDDDLMDDYDDGLDDAALASINRSGGGLDCRVLERA